MARWSAGTKASRGTSSIASIIRISVTSLGRTWPSTIFWRAVEKPDIGEPWSGADTAAKSENLRHLWYKVRQNAISRLRSAATSLPSPLEVRNALFDGDRESADQTGNLVQILGILGIMFLEGLGQADTAFVVAQCGDVAVARNDRRHRWCQVGL